MATYKIHLMRATKQLGGVILWKPEEWLAFGDNPDECLAMIGIYRAMGVQVIVRRIELVQREGATR